MLGVMRALSAVIRLASPSPLSQVAALGRTIRGVCARRIVHRCNSDSDSNDIAEYGKMY
jgi:hypothetical protein